MFKRMLRSALAVAFSAAVVFGAGVGTVEAATATQQDTGWGAAEPKGVVQVDDTGWGSEPAEQTGTTS